MRHNWHPLSTSITPRPSCPVYITRSAQAAHLPVLSKKSSHAMSAFLSNNNRDDDDNDNDDSGFRINNLSLNSHGEHAINEQQQEERWWWRGSFGSCRRRRRMRRMRRGRTSIHAATSSDVWRPGAYDPDLVAIPGAEATLGSGDPLRSLTLSAAEHFHGAWTDNAEYFVRADEPLSQSGRVLRLLGVCWLAVGGTLEGVPAGRYECILRCRLTSVPNFVAYWRIGVGVSHEHDFDHDALDDVGIRQLRNVHSGGRGGLFLRSLPRDRLSALSFGVLDLESPSSDVRFEMGGGRQSWARGLEFDALELRRVRPPWAVVRLLLLSADATHQPGDGKNSERPGCQLVRLPPDALRLIVRML
ncbi:hypothetical protein ACHAXA_000549 [Cyclostephanos tholiformis]|uniref:Uncharacterized protein n=1 Tax=Cyclostephanos tholiformis TaxID=382380 RepID=A0ABD3SSS7_9STRA